MQQEDDLRGLAKVMEFMRAISIVFIVIHVYWYCYRSFVDMGINIGVVDRILLNFQRTAGLFSNLLITKVFAVIFLALSCLGTKGVKNQKMTWQKYMPLSLPDWCCFHELVDARPAVQSDGQCHLVHGNTYSRVYPVVDVRRVDKPDAETQPHGRCIQYRQREFHAGDTAHGERVFRQPADKVRLSRQGMERMD